jgi:hypothetical protein
MIMFNIFNKDYRAARRAYKWWSKNGVKPSIVREYPTASFQTKSLAHHELVQIGHWKYYFPYNMQKGGVFHNLHRVVSKNGNDYVIHQAS